MPSICRFYGIINYMYWNEHAPPHFNAEYGEFEALIKIEDFSIYQGKLPNKAYLLVIE